MPEYNFRGYTYITLDITINISNFKACLNNSYLITLIDYSKFVKVLLDIIIKRILLTIKTEKIANVIYNNSDYILIILKISN